MLQSFRLHHDASLIMTNIQVMSQLATSFSRAASDLLVFNVLFGRKYDTSAV